MPCWQCSHLKTFKSESHTLILYKLNITLSDDAKKNKIILNLNSYGWLAEKAQLRRSCL
jgi:hypothetical protein